jgi:hypothetical protein
VGSAQGSSLWCQGGFLQGDAVLTDQIWLDTQSDIRDERYVGLDLIWEPPVPDGRGSSPALHMSNTISECAFHQFLTSEYLKKSLSQGRTGQSEQDRLSRTARTRQPGQESLNITTRAPIKVLSNRTAMTEQTRDPERDSSIRKDFKDKITRARQLEQDYHDKQYNQDMERMNSQTG